MDTRRPATYGPCPYRSGRPGQPARTPPSQAQAVHRASAAALAQPVPAAEPEPAAPTTPPPAPQMGRSHLSAYAADFTVTAEHGRKEPLPLAAQRAEGGMALADGGVAVPEDGYYMVLWELGVAGADGEAALHLGVNDAASQLTYALRPGYDNGQQVTWLGKGDRLGLFLQAEDERAEIHCGSAQFTVIRLG
ncbi:MAG: hypothetical protein FWF60_03810 [Oscillospiraceae bacterium]|nr:hypothetical protein [Oscillospiraceae bacterium]